jgi:opacity protein-like surface antigen
MKLNWTTTFLLSLVTTAFISQSALAVDPGWYGNFSLGTTNYSEKELTDVCGAYDIPCGVDNDPANFRFGAGYKFNPYLSLEGGYQNLGEVNYSVLSIDVVSFSAKGPYASLVGELPLGDGRFSLLGSIGGTYIDGKLSTAPILGDIDVLSEKAILPFAGIGAGINSKTGKYGVRFMWERTDLDLTYKLNGREIDAPSVDVFAISAIIRLGK